MARGLRDLDEAVTYALWQAQLATRQALEQVLRPLDLTVSQFGTLAFLAREGPRSAADVARRLAIRPQSVAAGVHELERRGLVTRSPHPEHGRVVLVRLAPAGLALARRGDAAIERFERRLLAPLPPRRRQELLAGLRQILANARTV
jgi:DNA-binding MarR family transcriptional regulator